VHHQAATLGKLLTPMCLCHQAVQFGTGQRAVVLCGREGTVGLASHWPCVTDFSGLSTCGLTATEREMSTPPTLCRSMVLFTFTSVSAAWLAGSLPQT